MNSHAAVRHGQRIGVWERESPPPLATTNRGERVIVGHVLVGVMVVGAVSLFTVVPLVCLLLAATITSSQTAAVLVAIVVVPAAMVAIGSQLIRLDRLHAKVADRLDTRRVAPAYRRGLTDTNRTAVSTSVLEGVMVTSVAIAGLIYLVWFFVFAGSPLPA